MNLNNKKAPGRATVEHPEIAELEIIPGTGGQKKRPRSLKVWLDRSKALGLQNRQLVWELHVIQGFSKAETARQLQISPTRVDQLYDEAKQGLMAQVPQNPEDFAMLREELKARLLSVYEDASQDKKDPRMLAIRLKTVEQLSKLHGLNLEAPIQVESGSSQYATPEELREAVSKRLLELHGRGQDLQAIRDVFADQKNSESVLVASQ